jgi:uncharacterized membrane protein
MKNPLVWISTITAAGFIIAGITYFSKATDPADHIGVAAARTPALVAGVTCLVLATGLLVAALFAFRKRD